MFGNHAGEFGQPAGGRVALHDAVQHGHEVALAGAEAAVQERRLGEPGLKRRLQKPEGLVKLAGEFGGDDIAGEGFRGRLVAHAVGEFQHEIIALDRCGDLDQFGKQGHPVSFQALTTTRGEYATSGAFMARGAQVV